MVKEYRKFGRKKYMLEETYTHKIKATQEAKNFRKKGMPARVIKLTARQSKAMGKRGRGIFWALYVKK